MKSFHKALLSLCFISTNAILLSNNSYAQSAPALTSVVPPSPNVQAMQKYGDIPVGIYTGIPNISIPLYDVKFKDISVPISLSYHASGIKVAEEASQVGLGWVINAGGSISRNIVGADDFNGSVYFNSLSNNLPDLTGNHGPIYLVKEGKIVPRFNRNIANQNTIDTLDIKPYVDAAPPLDFQPDQFYYNFLDHSGKFILRRNKDVFLQKKENIQITCMAADGSAWQVKSADGYIYDFTVIESYQEVAIVKTAWYLSKITSPTGNTVTFNYNIIPNQYVKSVGSYTDNWDYFDVPMIAGEELLYYVPPSLGRQQGVVPGKNYSLVVLDNIDFNTGIVKFNYSDRVDLSGDRKLDSLTVFTRNSAGALSTTPIKTVNLIYSYFDHGIIDDRIGTSTTDNSKRLKLLQVQQSGNYNGVITRENPYVFTYNETYWQPSKGSFARDHWGYYNGKTLNSSLIPSITTVSSPDLITYTLGVDGPERNADPVFTGSYSLAAIQYPTGGTTEFQFESNTFDEQQSHVGDMSYFNKTNSVVQQTARFNFDNQGSRTVTPSDTLDLTSEYVFTQDPLTQKSTTVSLNVVIRFGSSSACNTVFPDGTLTFDLLDVTGNSILHKNVSYFNACSGGATTDCMSCQSGVFVYNTANLPIPPGKYLIAVHVDPMYAATLQDIHFNFSYYTEVSSAANYSTGNNVTYSQGGGQRILRIIDHDAGNSANIKVRKFIYHYMADKDNSGTVKEYSYGRRMTRPGYSNFVISTDVLIYYKPTGTATYVVRGVHHMRSADSSNPLNGSAGGSNVGYDQVTVLYGENGENGKSEYHYANLPDTVYAYNDETYNLPLRPPAGSTVPSQLNGSLLQQIDFKNVQGSFVKVKAVSNTYGLKSAYGDMTYSLEPRLLYTSKTETDYSGKPTITGPNTDGSTVLLTGYTMKSQFPFLSGTDEKVYDQSDTTKYVETTSTTYYDNLQHLMPTKVITSNSKGETTTTYMKYPLDFTSLNNTDAISKGVSNLITNHMHDIPVEKYIQKTAADGSNMRTVSATITTYSATGPSLPATVYGLQSVTPLTSFTSYAASGAMNPAYQPELSFDSYDPTNGNLLQQHKTDDINNSYLWGYNKQYPVAQAVNASVNDIFYDSFEEGDGNSTYNDARTGHYSYSGTYSHTLSGLDAGTYTLSYWTKSGGVWTLVVNNNVAVTGSSYTIALSGQVDDIRFYPYAAQMTTYTYDPLIGMTSSTDVKGETTYYEYDALQRLLNIKDMNGNIVKHFDYHYQGQ